MTKFTSASPITRTPLTRLSSIGPHSKVFVKDESVNPTGTFKDRLARKAIAKGGDEVVFGSISYGNTALSFASACRHAPWASFVAYVPQGFAGWSFGPSSTGQFVRGDDVLRVIRNYGAAAIELDLASRRLTDQDLAALAQQAGLLRGRKFVDVTEGLDEPAYAPIAREALEQLPEAPAVCIVQYGAGILANEVRDVFAELSPATQVIPISTPREDSLARMLFGPIWLDVEVLRHEGVAASRHTSPDRTGVTRQPYPVYAVSEAQIRLGIEIAKAHGVSAEPSGSAGLGFLDSIQSIVPTYDPSSDCVLVINTGNGIDHLATTP